VHVEARYKEIEYNADLLNRFDAITEKQKDHPFAAMSIRTTVFSPLYKDIPYTDLEIFYLGNHAYAKAVDKKGAVHVYQQYEYDLVNDCLTDVPFETLKGKDYESHSSIYNPGAKKDFFESLNNVKPRPMPAPTAKLFYMDFIDKGESNKIEIKKPKYKNAFIEIVKNYADKRNRQI